MRQLLQSRSHLFFRLSSDDSSEDSEDSSELELSVESKQGIFQFGHQ